MIVEWEDKDIEPGRRFSREGIKEIWIIGYLPWIVGPDRYVTISSSDGMVTTAKSRAALAVGLTKEKYMPIELMPAKEKK